MSGGLSVNRGDGRNRVCISKASLSLKSGPHTMETSSVNSVVWREASAIRQADSWPHSGAGLSRGDWSERTQWFDPRMASESE